MCSPEFPVTMAESTVHSTGGSTTLAGGTARARAAHPAFPGARILPAVSRISDPQPVGNFGHPANQEVGNTARKEPSPQAIARTAQTWRATAGPGVTLPLRFVITGFLSLLTGVAMLLVRPDLLATYHYNQYAVAVTHLLVLGFMVTVVMGATYQLVPVALEVSLHSERLARWQFLFHVVGFVGMVWMFWRWDLEQVGHYASVLAVGVGMYAWNVGRTLLKARRWDAVAQGIASAVLWLGLTVLVGLALAAGKCTYESAADRSWLSPVGFLVHLLAWTAALVQKFEPVALMHAHAHLGGAGFFVVMIIAVSYKLVPMFTLSEVQSERRAFWSIWLFNAGLAGLFVTMTLHSAWKPAFVGLLLAALAIYGVEVAAIFRARRRRVIDWGLRYYLTALGLLGLAAGLGVVLCWPGLPATILTTQLETVYGFLGLIGVVALTIIGFLHKIVPFLVWYRSYSPQVGRHRVPMLGDLFSEHLQRIAYRLYMAALVVVCAGSAGSSGGWVRVGVGLLLASLLLFGINLFTMVRHLWRPQLQPVQPR